MAKIVVDSKFQFPDKRTFFPVSDRIYDDDPNIY